MLAQIPNVLCFTSALWLCDCFEFVLCRALILKTTGADFGRISPVLQPMSTIIETKLMNNCADAEMRHTTDNFRYLYRNISISQNWLNTRSMWSTSTRAGMKHIGIMLVPWLHSLAPRKCGIKFKSAISKHMLRMSHAFFGEITLRWILHTHTYIYIHIYTTLVHAMACFRHTTSHYLSQCWTKSNLCRHMASLVHNEIILSSVILHHHVQMTSYCLMVTDMVWFNPFHAAFI